MHSEFDIIIVGGGLVGSVMAIALAQLKFSVALIESNQPVSKNKKEPRDDRAIVLSLGSKNILESLGLWSFIESHVTPVKSIQISDQGHFAKTRIHAADHQVEALGFVVLAHPLAIGLTQAIELHSDFITPFYSAQFEAFEGDTNNIVLNVNGKKEILKSDLVIAADGTNSRVRTALNIESTIYHYDQCVIIARVDLEKSHQFRAYERFTPHGPLALLPDGEQSARVIWTLETENAKQVAELESSLFIARLQTEFGYRLGPLKNPTTPYLFPLQLLKAKILGKNGVILIGNAAHTLHPIAGQGLNLGLRDVAQLAELLFKYRCKKIPFNQEQLLNEFSTSRESDHKNIINITHGLITIFGNSFLPAVIGRNIGLTLMDHIPFLSTALTRGTLGLSGKISKLASRQPISEWCYDETN